MIWKLVNNFGKQNTGDQNNLIIESIKLPERKIDQRYKVANNVSNKGKAK